MHISIHYLSIKCCLHLLHVKNLLRIDIIVWEVHLQTIHIDPSKESLRFSLQDTNSCSFIQIPDKKDLAGRK